MKLSDIVIRLSNTVPRYTSLFSESITVESAAVSGGVVTVVTSAPHGLITGEFVTVGSSTVRHTVSSLTHEGDGVVTCVLATDHDLTEGWQPTVIISGATQAQYNGTFTLLEVPNRRTFTYQTTSTPVISPATGTIYFHEKLERGINGTYQVTVTNATTFTYSINNTDLSLPITNATINGKPRIIGCATIDRFLKLYEQFGTNRNWLCVVMDDATVSKNRGIPTDVYNQSGGGTYTSIQLIEPFSVMAIIPTKNDGTGIDAVDLAYDEVRNVIIKALNGYQFSSGLEEDTYTGATFKGHNFLLYQNSFYMHEYQFETVKDITDFDGRFSDSGDQEPTRAFRDMILQSLNDYDVTVQQTNINLDDQPL